MPRKKSVPSRRQRLGKVTLYQHHGAWYLYYREAGRAKRLRVSSDFAAAKQIAAEVNAKLSCGLRSPYSFEPILVADLRLKYLDHHEHIECSSLATLKRYRSATNHLANFAGKIPAHDVQAEEFLRHLRKLRVSVVRIVSVAVP